MGGTAVAVEVFAEDTVAGGTVEGAVAGGTVEGAVGVGGVCGDRVARGGCAGGGLCCGVVC